MNYKQLAEHLGVKVCKIKSYINYLNFLGHSINPEKITREEFEYIKKTYKPTFDYNTEVRKKIKYMFNISYSNFTKLCSKLKIKANPFILSDYEISLIKRRINGVTLSCLAKKTGMKRFIADKYIRSLDYYDEMKLPNGLIKKEYEDRVYKSLKIKKESSSARAFCKETGIPYTRLRKYKEYYPVVKEMFKNRIITKDEKQKILEIIKKEALFIRHYDVLKDVGLNVNQYKKLRKQYPYKLKKCSIELAVHADDYRKFVVWAKKQKNNLL